MDAGMDAGMGEIMGETQGAPTAPLGAIAPPLVFRALEVLGVA